MDEKAVRRQAAEVKTELTRNEREHEVLLSLLKGLEGWLELNGSRPRPAPHLLLSSADGQAKPPKLQEVPSARGSVLKVIREAGGASLHVKDILEQVRQMGARVKEDNPAGMIDLMLYSLKKSEYPVEKVGPRTWRWAGDQVKQLQIEDTESKGESEEETPGD